MGLADSAHRVAAAAAVRAHDAAADEALAILEGPPLMNDLLRSPEAADQVLEGLRLPSPQLSNFRGSSPGALAHNANGARCGAGVGAVCSVRGP